MDYGHFLSIFPKIPVGERLQTSLRPASTLLVRW